jgi:hypothetical protein
VQKELQLARGNGRSLRPRTAFIADLQEDWEKHGKEIFPIMREKFPRHPLSVTGEDRADHSGGGGRQAIGGEAKTIGVT